MENLKNLLESRSSNLIGSSCDFQMETITQKSKFEKIISVGIAYPEYDDVSESDESIEDISEENEKQIYRKCNCSVDKKSASEQFILSPTILCLICFQLGICTTMFTGYFCKFCTKGKQKYQHLETVLTVPTHTDTESTAVIHPEEEDRPIQELRETMLCPETPPPSYRSLFMSHY